MPKQQLNAEQSPLLSQAILTATCQLMAFMYSVGIRVVP